MLARQKAAMHQIYSEDERRMRFYALLCGRGASKRNNDVRNNNGNNAFPSQLMSRERSGSIGGMGMLGENNSGKGASASSSREKVGAIKSVGKGVGLSGGIRFGIGLQQQLGKNNDNDDDTDQLLRPSAQLSAHHAHHPLRYWCRPRHAATDDGRGTKPY